MALMQIPSHESVAPQAMAEGIQVCLRQVGIRACRVVRAGEKVRGFGREHFTLVPFFCYFLEGSCELSHAEPMGGEVESETVHPGSALLFAAESYVPLNFPVACRFLRVTFEPDGLFVGLEAISGIDPKKGMENRSRLEATWVDGPMPQPAPGLMQRLFNPSGGGVEPQRRAIFECLVWELFERLSAEDSRKNSPTNLAQAALRYLRDQCGRPINRETSAEALCISPGYLGRLVKEATGLTFQENLQQMRMEHARALLCRPHLSIEEIALQCGYTSANYFAQAFRRSEGRSPREWRERQQPVYPLND